MFAPTGVSGLILFACMFLPVGMYQGCGNAPLKSMSPIENQADALRSGELGNLLITSIPYVFALVIFVGSLAAGWLDGRRAFRGLSFCYALLIVVTCLLMLSLTLVSELNSPGRTLAERWQSESSMLLTVFWLANILLAIWLEAPSWFVAAMILQWVMVLFIWCGLAQWLLFLDHLLLGGWLTAGCALLLPLSTLLQLYADPAAGRDSSRVTIATAEGRANGTPQFTLASLMTITTVLAAVLSIWPIWGFEASLLFFYASTLTILAVRHGRAARTRAGYGRLTAAWYLLAAILVSAGALTHIALTPP